MTPAELKRSIDDLDPTRPVLLEIKGDNDTSWYHEINRFDIIRAKSSNHVNIISINHPGFLKLPKKIELDIELFTCSRGHSIAMLKDHPYVNDRPVCPHCLATYLG